MATDVGLEALAARMGRVEALLKGDMTPVGHAVGRGARVEANAVAGDVSGGDQRLSHMGRKGARLGMRYDLDDQGRRVTIALRPAGPWVLVESGAKPHAIPKGRGRDRGRPRYLMAPSYAHPVRGPITHPGAKGKGAVRRTFGRIRGRASNDAHEAWVKQLGEVFR